MDRPGMDRPGTDIGIRKLGAFLDLILTAGSLSKASRELGRHRNYFRGMHERGSISWSTYHEMLARYRVDDRQLTRWAHCVAGEPALERFGAEAFALALRHEPTALKRIGLAYLRGQLANDEIVFLPSALLGEVDDLRYTDPAAAEKQARAFLRQASTVQNAARALAVWGSALKYCNKLDHAQLVLWNGMRIAACEGLTEPLGDLIQRAAYVISDRGDFMQAYELACRAHVTFVAHGHHSRVGQALVTQGIMLHRAGETEREVAPFTKALETLDVADKRNRFAAFQALSANAAGRGDLRLADDFAARAQECVPGKKVFLARVLWLRARIAVALSNFGKADLHYKDTVGLFGRIRPIEAMIATAERAGILAQRIRLLADCHRFDDARRVARSLRWATTGLEDTVPQGANVVRELIVAADQPLQFADRAGTLARRLEDIMFRVASYQGMKPFCCQIELPEVRQEPGG